MGDYSHAAMHKWLHAPLVATLVGLFVVSSFWHARLGLQVLVEDYVKTSGNKFAVFALLNLLTFGGAAFGVLSVIRIALGAA
jgi:succinate dehydrogenase / fumarate reductase membrane anchor subunit